MVFLDIALLLVLSAGCFLLFSSKSTLDKWAKWRNKPLKIKTNVSDSDVIIIRIVGFVLVLSSLYFGYTVLMK